MDAIFAAPPIHPLAGKVATAIIGLLQLPPQSVIPELTILPLQETSWP